VLAWIGQWKGKSVVCAYYWLFFSPEICDNFILKCFFCWRHENDWKQDLEKYSLLCRFCFSLCSSFGFVTQIKALGSRHQQSIVGFFFYFMTILVLYIQVTEKFCWKCDSLDLRIEHRHFQSHKCIFERLPVLSEIWKKNYDTFTRLWRIVRTTHKRFCARFAVV